MARTRLTWSGLGAAAALSVLMMTAAPGADAATFTSCVGTGFDISNNVSGATGCTIGSQTQDNVNPPLVVNQSPGYFGFTDWIFLKKDESSSGKGQSGSYDFGSAFGSYGDVMLIFKDGNGTTLVGYTVGTASGTWDSPYEVPPFPAGGNGNNTNTKDVSHVSYYVRDPNIIPPPITDIPEPMTLALFGLGLAGLGVARRRKA